MYCASLPGHHESSRGELAISELQMLYSTRTPVIFVLRTLEH
jgi:hypothetical protein